MNPYEITFNINGITKIIVDFLDPLSLVCWSYAQPILLSHNKELILLAEHPTYFNIRDFRDILQKVLKNDLSLHSSIKEDIGYLYNGYIYNPKGFATESSGESWVGSKYRLWNSYENEKKYITWMYNNTNGDIILEVTPSYPYFFCDIKKQKYYIPFKKWIVQYRPYLKTVISRERAQEWLDQAEHIVKSVDENIARWEREAKERELSGETIQRKKGVDCCY